MNFSQQTYTVASDCFGRQASGVDVAMAHAARSADTPSDGGASVNEPSSTPGRGVVTIEMKTSFMRPATGRLTARGRVLTRTVALAFCEASLFDEAGARFAPRPAVSST